jgi:hypothetical protein
MPDVIVNDKQTIIRLPEPRYFHCYKLNESNVALFDVKMDMPIVIGSIAIIKSCKLPPNSTVFYYKLMAEGFFAKGADKFMEIDGDGKHIKPPLRYHYVDPQRLMYHHFKLSPVVSVLFDDRFTMPIVYGSNQKVQAVINKVSKAASIFYYKEDVTFKHSFKLWMMYKGKG